MSLDEDALETVANGGSMDLERWADMVAPLLERLEHIVHNVFPMPKVPPGSYDQQPFAQPPSHLTEANSAPLESSNKENAAPENSQTPSPPQAPTGSPPSSERVPDSQPQSSEQQSNDSLPPPLGLLLSSIRSAIQSFFVEKPPHTIQRLAELILHPTAHYRTLPAYLRAVDRVVSVTSGADVFPFNAPASASPQLNGLVHPTHSAGACLAPDYAAGLGSDESLGGALLTPIPWLTNASFGGEEAAVMPEQATVPTQSQEPDAGATITTTTTETEEAAATSASPPAESPDEVPHARGPPVVGVEDLGLQDGKGVEMNLGEQGAQDMATGDGASDAPPAAGASATEKAQDGNEATAADKDGDIVLEDTKGKDEETKTADMAAAAPEGNSGDSVQASELDKNE